MEIWATIPGLDGYEVSTFGRLRSLDRIVIRSNGSPLPCWGKMLSLKPDIAEKGHVSFEPRKGGPKMYVHTAVLLAFVGPKPVGTEACHNNGIPSDNRLENLRWDTRKSNRADVIRHGDDPQLRRAFCKNGHAWTKDNTRMRSDGARACKTCARENMRRYRSVA